jgi:signal transduction histidine kinase
MEKGLTLNNFYQITDPIKVMGLRNIKERVKHLQERLKIESSAEKGTIIVVEIY